MDVKIPRIYRLGVFTCLAVVVMVVACTGSREPAAPATTGAVGVSAACAGQRGALVALYKATSGDNWRGKDNWLSDQPVDNWFGVYASNDGCINGLSLRDNQLSGGLPSELGQLVNLEWLDLDENQLSGAIPPELGKLANLVSLDLRENQLTGAIPPELGNLANLERLDLLENQLGGEIPPELGNLANLERLDLLENQLSGEIPPELGKLVSLTALYLGVNQLSGAIPPELGKLAELETLDLRVNLLTEEIPPELGYLASLTWLDLDGNWLSGGIPVELGNLVNLEYLSLTGNEVGWEKWTPKSDKLERRRCQDEEGPARKVYQGIPAGSSEAGIGRESVIARGRASVVLTAIDVGVLGEAI